MFSLYWWMQQNKQIFSRNHCTKQFWMDTFEVNATNKQTQWMPERMTAFLMKKGLQKVMLKYICIKTIFCSLLFTFIINLSAALHVFFPWLKTKYTSERTYVISNKQIIINDSLASSITFSRVFDTRAHIFEHYTL